MARRVGPVSVVVDSATVERFLNFVIIRQKFENEKKIELADHKSQNFVIFKDFLKISSLEKQF